MLELTDCWGLPVTCRAVQVWDGGAISLVPCALARATTMASWSSLYVFLVLLPDHPACFGN